jgi:tight adherence protein C
MYQLLIPMLTFVAVIAVGGAILVLRAGRQRSLQARLYGRRSAELEPWAEQPQMITNALEQVGRAVASEQDSGDLRQKLAQAGYYSASAPTVYVGAQLMLFVFSLGIVDLAVVGLPLSLVLRILIGFVIVAVLTLVPNVWVALRQRSRRREVGRHLPDAIDLLEICVSAGMGLDMAWNAVTDEFRPVSHILADEMALVNLEIHLGAPRADALRHMARRTGVDDISSMVATLVQSERFGTSVSQALRAYAEAMRTERSQRAEEAAEKLMVKMLFPMVLFIFPVLFIVILGPAGIKIAQMFRSG